MGLLVLCLAALFVGKVAPARADTTTPLPFTPSSSGSLIVDPAGQHVFVSAGSGGSAIAVFDFAGNLVQTITGEDGASGMALDPATHTLYVALYDAPAIAAIDTTTLTETARYPIPWPHPWSLAFAGGQVWISGFSDEVNGWIASMAPDGSGLTQQTLQTGVGTMLLAAGGPGDNLLAAATENLEPATVSVFDVSQPTPTLIKSAWNPTGDTGSAESMTFTPSGQDLLLASATPSEVTALNSTTLVSDATYPTGAYPASAAVSFDGNYVAASRSNPNGDGPELYIFPTGETTPVASLDENSGIGDLAFSPDGTRLFGLTNSSGQPVLAVIDNPTVPQPDTTITSSLPTSGPAHITYSTKASFTFSSPDDAATFECNLDNGGWQPCTSPVSYSGLGNIGYTHSFQVRAVDVVADPTPASESWIIQLPGTTLISGPATVTYSTSASFQFSSDDSDATFQCRLDGSDWSACTTPATYTGLAPNTHTFEVEAVNDGGMPDPTPASETWSISQLDTSLTQGPPSDGYATGASFSFSSPDGAATFECSLDGSDWQACSSPVSYSGLSIGTHTFQARAVDGSVIDPTPASQTWTVEPPDTNLTSGPDASTYETTASFDFSSDDAAASFQCSLDDAAWSACSSPATYTGLAIGTHTFRVEAVNDAGGADLRGASESWSINAIPPLTAELSVSPNPVATGNAVTLDASGSSDVLGTIVDYKWDLGTGSFDHDTGSTSTVTTSFASPGPQHVRVQVTDDRGATAIASVTVDVDLAPPPGPVGVSINNGDYATNSPDVQLDVTWPVFAQNVLISNDGGFGTGTKTVPVAPTIPWTLDSGGSERLPQIVYLRFPDSANPTVTFSDNIVLDTTAPVVQAATIAGVKGTTPKARRYEVRLRAKEKISGISEVRFSRARHGGETVMLRDRSTRGVLDLWRTLTVRMPAAPKWVRVLSTAGTWSKWHQVS